MPAPFIAIGVERITTQSPLQVGSSAPMATFEPDSVPKLEQEENGGGLRSRLNLSDGPMTSLYRGLEGL